MKLVRTFSCDNCTADGKIIIKNSSNIFYLKDIVSCPLCAGDISEELDEDDE